MPSVAPRGNPTRIGLCLLREYVLQSIEECVKSRGIDRTKTADQPLFVQGSNLIQQNQTIFDAKLDRNPPRRRPASRRHRGGNDNTKIVVHFRRRDDYTWPAFLNLAPNRRIEHREPDIPSCHTDLRRSLTRGLHHARSTSSSLPNSGQTSASSPAIAISCATSAHPARG
jgi:hypothetical protein